MKRDEDFIKLGEFEGALNATQTQLLQKERLSQADANLFLLLRGDFDLSVQEQLVANYKLLAQYHKDKKAKPKKASVVNSAGEELTIYCDGACKGNPGRSGSGLALYEGSKKPVLLYGEYQEMGTNNTAELNALHKALLIAQESEGSKVSICCDSKYSIDCITNWAYSWKAKGWTKKGGEIKNLEVIQKAHALYEALKERVIIKHVKGHAGVEGNELADRMAVYAVLMKNENYEVYEYDELANVLEMGEG
jgi:ribonuclease HI